METVASIDNGTVIGKDGSDKSVRINLKRVLYFLEFEGLFFVSKMVVKEYAVSFSETDKIKSAVIAVGDKVDNLYRLKTEKGSLKVISKHHERCQHTWHRRF